MSTVSRVGGDVDAFCTKCKLKLGHTVLAMVGTRLARVRCNTCQGEHAYRANPPGTAAPRKRAAASRDHKPERAKHHDLDDLLEGRDTAQARRYGAGEVYQSNELLSHPTFGTGVVVAVRGDRIDAVFTAGVKTLTQKKSVQSFAKRQERAPAVETAEDIESERVVEPTL